MNVTNIINMCDNRHTRLFVSTLLGSHNGLKPLKWIHITPQHIGTFLGIHQVGGHTTAQVSQPLLGHWEFGLHKNLLNGHHNLWGCYWENWGTQPHVNGLHGPFGFQNDTSRAQRLHYDLEERSVKVVICTKLAMCKVPGEGLLKAWGIPIGIE
jgi:hypothetical protein